MYLLLVGLQRAISAEISSLTSCWCQCHAFWATRSLKQLVFNTASWSSGEEQALLFERWCKQMSALCTDLCCGLPDVGEEHLGKQNPCLGGWEANGCSSTAFCNCCLAWQQGLRAGSLRLKIMSCSFCFAFWRGKLRIHHKTEQSGLCYSCAGSYQL